MIILTAKQIGDLAVAAGFTIDVDPDDGQLDTEYTIVKMDPKKGVLNDDNVMEYYAHVAYLTDYPEEGSFPLGDKLSEPT